MVGHNKTLVPIYPVAEGLHTGYHAIFSNQFILSINCRQDKIFRRKRLSTCADFVHVYIEIWDKGILKFNKFSM